MMVDPEEIIGQIFEAEQFMDPETFRPYVTIKSELTIELMQDLNACFDLDRGKLADFLGRALLHTLTNTPGSMFNYATKDSTTEVKG